MPILHKQVHEQKIFDFHARLIPDNTSLNRLIRMMDDLHIKCAVVSAGGTIPLGQLSRQIIEGGFADVDADNDFVLDACTRAKGRLVPFYFANPRRDPDHYRDRANQFSGLELAPAVHGVALNDSRTSALIEIAATVGHPVYLHCLIRNGFSVTDLVVLANQFPSVNFVLGHSGIGHIDLYGIDLISKTNNVLLETSGGYTRVIQYALERLGPNRLLFGTEYPIQHPAVELAKYRVLNLDSTTWEQVAWINACRILGITAEPLIDENSVSTKHMIDDPIDLGTIGSATQGKSHPLTSRTQMLSLIIGALFTSQQLFAADWSDTFVSYRIGNEFTEPTNPNKIHKDIFSFTHVSGYKYGTNFFATDFMVSDDKDPALNGGGGAQEIYAVYRHKIALGTMTNIKMGGGILKDVGITVGVDLNSKNDNMGPRVQKTVFGPTLNFDVPGFLEISLLYRTEKNHNGITGKSVTFDDTYGISAAWSLPITSISAKFDGIVNYIGKKGKDGFDMETGAETLARAYFMFDVGTLFSKQGTFYAGIGYEYWRNKYGTPPGITKDTNAPMMVLEAHF